MARKSWKNRPVNSIPNAMELCLEYAKARHNLSVDRVADRMGLANKWVIYKWIESGRIPAVLIRPFEHACGINFITRYLAHSDHKLLIDIPVGRQIEAADTHQLSETLNTMLGQLMKHYNGGRQDVDELMESLLTSMEALGWHHGNLENFENPQLQFGDTNNE